MKMKYFMIISLCILTQYVKGQNIGTTTEEYNYLTKGYKIQLESGLDMKQGYELKPVTTVQYNFSDLFGEYKYTFEFNDLVSVATGEQRATLCIIRKNGSALYFLAMPNQFSEKTLWNTYIQSLKPVFSSDTYNMPSAFCYATSRLSQMR
jgi:hypothetical protein